VLRSATRERFFHLQQADRAATLIVGIELPFDQVPVDILWVLLALRCADAILELHALATLDAFRIRDPKC